jgi:hypothetical protein
MIQRLSKLPGPWAPALVGCVLAAAISLGGPGPVSAQEADLVQTIAAYQHRIVEIRRVMEEIDRELASIRQQLDALRQAPLTVIVQKRLDDSFVVESVAFWMDGQSLLIHRQPIHELGSFTLTRQPVAPGTHTFAATVDVRGSTGESHPSDVALPPPSPPPYTAQGSHEVTVHPGRPVNLMVDIFINERWIETHPTEPQVEIRE